MPQQLGSHQSGELRRGESAVRANEQPPLERSGCAGTFVQRLVDATPRARDELDPATSAAIDVAQGTGQPLESTVREGMEAAFGRELGTVRIHADDRADALARAVAARAFTVGSDIFFRRYEYRPTAVDGLTLLTHELTHVIQQTGGAWSGPLTVGDPDDPLEREAEAVAHAFNHTRAISQGADVEPQRVQPSGGGLGLRRCACGGWARADGECPECKRKRLSQAAPVGLQRQLAVTAPGDSTRVRATPPTATPRFGGPPPLRVCGDWKTLVDSVLGLEPNIAADAVTCFCLGAGIADLVPVPGVGTNPWIELADCTCNILTTLQEIWKRGDEGGCWSPGNYDVADAAALGALGTATAVDCGSLPVGSAFGTFVAGLVGGASGGAAGGPPGAVAGGGVGAIVGAALGDLILDLAAMAMQNYIIQGSVKPVAQMDACGRLADRAGGRERSPNNRRQLGDFPWPVDREAFA